VNEERFAERRRRAIEAAEAAELAGLLVAPGPDLAYLVGYTPPPLERLTLLLLTARREPTLVVPTLERALAESAAGAAGLDILDWRDGTDDPYELVAQVLGSGRYAVTARTWA
jgi:Xaa-Pro aminopeptidase